MDLCLGLIFISLVSHHFYCYWCPPSSGCCRKGNREANQSAKRQLELSATLVKKQEITKPYKLKASLVREFKRVHSNVWNAALCSSSYTTMPWRNDEIQHARNPPGAQHTAHRTLLPPTLPPPSLLPPSACRGVATPRRRRIHITSAKVRSSNRISWLAQCYNALYSLMRCIASDPPCVLIHTGTHFE